MNFLYLENGLSAMTFALKIPKRSLASVAYETIKKKIICLEYEPGRHLEESQLVESLGIGRTPIREALVRLQGERMVISHPNRGIVVRPVTLQNTKAMFESMHIFESGVAAVAVKKDCSTSIGEMKRSNDAVKKAILANHIFDLVEANHDFHVNFADCSQNEFMIRAVKDVRTEAKRLSYLSYNNAIDPERPLETHYQSVVEEHDMIIDALMQRDKTKLERLLKEHIETFRQRIVIFMTS